MTNDSRMSARDDRTLRERLRDNDEVLAEMNAICSGEWKPGPGMVLGLLARASVALAATTDRLARVERHHDEHHAREKRIWDAIGGEPEDDADPEVVELDDAVRVTLQYERDQVEQARSVIDAAKAVLPEHLLAEPDLIFAVKVLAGNYAGAQKTNDDFGAHIGELERGDWVAWGVWCVPTHPKTARWPEHWWGQFWSTKDKIALGTATEFDEPGAKAEAAKQTKQDPGGAYRYEARPLLRGACVAEVLNGGRP